MDIRAYFQKIRAAERNIQDPYTVVISLDTPEGGKPGQSTEVSRASAAQLVVEGKARLATAEEVAAFYQSSKEAFAAAEEEKLASRIQLTVVSEQPRNIKPRAEKG